MGEERSLLGCFRRWNAGRTNENGQNHTRRRCVDNVEDCYGRRILEWQPDFLEQEVMEEITQCGHLVMFYLKFHCEVNWIEYFRGMESGGLTN